MAVMNAMMKALGREDEEDQKLQDISHFDNDVVDNGDIAQWNGTKPNEGNGEGMEWSRL